jgi:D-serine deaminase-like pyridoxal phosphate-dependent protein
VITCDAGHKSVSVDSGVPNCAVMGEPGLAPMKPSEEHLPIAIASDASPPALGSILYLLPRHICPTVNNANYAVLVEDGAVSSIVEVTARGHERPL